jgi:2-polyprenyl-3-methyl-5-hydroxy-6-metoxy-1,4-benzoquinol methylase
MTEDWKRDVLLCPKTGSFLQGNWPNLVNEAGERVEIDDWGIVRAGLPSNRGIEFHEQMEQGTTLRQLQHRPLHLAYWETPYYKQAIARFLELVEPTDKIAMDVGCGDGRFTEQLIELGYERVVGLDANLSSLVSLARHATERGFREKLLLVQSSAEDLPIRDNSVDVVLSMGVLYYLNEQYENGLRAITGTLKPGATLIASEPDLEGAAIKALLFEDLEDFLMTVNQRVFSEFHNGDRFKFRVFSRREVQDIYDKAGLEVLGSHGLSILPSLLRIRMIKGQLDPGKVAAMESEVRETFDYFDVNGRAFKHIIWHCVKRD